MDKEKNPKKKIPNRAFGLIKRLIRRVRDDDVPALGAEYAYHLLLALFPFLIFLAALSTYAPAATEEALEGLSALVPAQALKIVRATLNEIAFANRSNMISLGMIFTIWTASAGFAALARGFNKAYDVEETRGFLRVRALSLVFVPLVSLGIVLEAAAVVFGNVLLCGAPGAECRSPAANALLHALRLALPLVTMTLIFSLLYAVIPNRRQTFRQVLPGAAFASVAWALASLGFSFYVDRFADYARYYGSLGGVMILLVWLYLSSVVLLVGSEINAELIESKERKDGPRRR
ncbi:MAG TPA: YihY/virulence factor BrkB family protein [Clostridia bacterium]|nr:MAG: ribonuclease BN/unknown domain fusion protein [Firmicutes bacterium ADurb.Bin248]HOF99460.1 YihY/virulence factor BrkB family protein [Clostridia bacterium]HOS17884.1 YihY/virulence factor BrkB family protein [Clostridia bacterium]